MCQIGLEYISGHAAYQKAITISFEVVKWFGKSAQEADFSCLICLALLLRDQYPIKNYIN